ncbi:hypothetical protein GN956_G19153 [Arapaima gigas]
MLSPACSRGDTHAAPARGAYTPQLCSVTELHTGAEAVNSAAPAVKCLHSDLEMNAAIRSLNIEDHGEDKGLLCTSPESRLKRWLQLYRELRASKEDCEAGPQASPKRWIIMGSVIMLALTVMVLLLFWNYHCTFIDKLCKSKEESPMFPVFGDWDENSVGEGKQV